MKLKLRIDTVNNIDADTKELRTRWARNMSKNMSNMRQNYNIKVLSYWYWLTVNDPFVSVYEIHHKLPWGYSKLDVCVEHNRIVNLIIREQKTIRSVRWFSIKQSRNMFETRLSSVKYISEVFTRGEVKVCTCNAVIMLMEQFLVD